jgi:sortase A
MHHRGRRRVVVAALAITFVVVAACGSNSADTTAVGERADTEPTATTVAPASSTTQPGATTTLPSTTSTTSPPATTTTAPATTTSTLALPLGIQSTQPIQPPLDAYAREPVVEVGRITIPRLGVDTTMYSGIRIPTLDRGPGHWPGSALPGEVGNVVVAGHRTSANRVFRYIEQIEPGDEIVFEDERGRFVYRATRTEIVDPYSGIWIIEPTDTPTVTLFACHPPGSVRERIVVFGELVTA